MRPKLVWNLNHDLPASFRGAALLASNFALQWLEDPAERLFHWCEHLRPGGWLVLGVPTVGSFPQWHRAARAAGVPCRALELPAAGELVGAATRTGVIPSYSRVLRFSKPRQGGLLALRHLRDLGASASRTPALSHRQLRALLRHWPEDEPLTWEVLMLVGQKQA
jgi:malonyl-CoA O-methyltransferase